MSRKRGESSERLQHSKSLFYGAKRSLEESDISSEEDDVDDPTFNISGITAIT